MTNKKKLAKKLSARTLLSQKESLQIVEEVFSIIKDEIVSGNDVSIVGFGKFYIYQHSSRPVRNPKTQEEMVLEPYNCLRFKVSNLIKNSLKESKD
jgi:nucleoid DNA-binding protein